MPDDESPFPDDHDVHDDTMADLLPDDDGFGPGDSVFDAISALVGRPERRRPSVDDLVARAMEHFDASAGAPPSQPLRPRRAHLDLRPPARQQYHAVRRRFSRTSVTARASGPDELPRATAISDDGSITAVLSETPEGRLELRVVGPPELDGLVELSWEISDERFRLLTPLWPARTRERTATYDVGEAFDDEIDLLVPQRASGTELSEALIREALGPDAYGDARRAWRAWSVQGSAPPALAALVEELLDEYGG